jgi:uncharacterized integral membrane protein
MQRATKVKLIIALILVVLAVILILQNTESVETKLLFATVTMPRAILLLVTLAIGFGSGMTVVEFFGRRK